MVCTDIASGNRVSLAYIEEESCGVTPILTTLTNIAGDKTGGGADMHFTRATGSFIDDDFLKDQYITTSGFTNAGNNGTWIIKEVVSATILKVYDPDSAGVDEVAAAPNSLSLTLRTLRTTSRQIDLERDLLESEEVRASRQRADVRSGFNQVTGSPGYEMSVISLDDMMRGVMQSDWVVVSLTAPGNIGITAATPGVGEATISRASGNWEDDGVRQYDLFTATGFATGTNNITWQVKSVSGTDMVVYDPDEVATTDAAAGGVTLTWGPRMDVGSDLRTFSFEQRFNDVDEYRLFKGVGISEMSWTIDPESIVNGTFTVLGMSAEPFQATSFSPVTPIQAPTTQTFAAFDGVIYEGGNAIAIITSVEFTISNDLSTEGVVGSKFSPGIFTGTFSLEGTVTVFFEDATIFNKFLNEEDSSMCIRLEEPDDPDAYMNLVIPRVRYVTGTIDPPAQGPVAISMDFQGLETNVKDETGADIPTTFTIQRPNALGT